MKLSLFTPTNNPVWLTDTFASLRVQNYRNFEWVIVPNSGIRPEDVPEEIAAWEHVRIVPGPQAKNIGQLKRFACDQSHGDVFVELDHDDMLVPGALEHIAEAAKHGGFIYSDDAVFLDDEKLSSHSYAANYGWDSYPIYVYNQYFNATRTFDLTPRALCEVYFAPDHVRCWTREAYYKAGGHDPNLLVADDHDLVCRTYLAGIEFRHTGYCDYLYRMHAKNSVRRYQGDIISLQNENREAYLWRLIDEWCRRKKFRQLDLSECRDYRDMSAMLQGLSGDVGSVRASNCLQYLRPDELGSLLNAVHRALAPGGFLCLRCPSTDGPGAFRPAHRSLWNTETVHCITDRRLAWQLPSYQGGFQRVRCWQEFDDKLAEKRKCPSLCADLMAVKGQRTPGVPYKK